MKISVVHILKWVIVRSNANMAQAASHRFMRASIQGNCATRHVCLGSIVKREKEMLCIINFWACTQTFLDWGYWLPRINNNYYLCCRQSMTNDLFANVQEQSTQITVLCQSHSVFGVWHIAKPCLAYFTNVKTGECFFSSAASLTSIHFNYTLDHDTFHVMDKLQYGPPAAARPAHNENSICFFARVRANK